MAAQNRQLTALKRSSARREKLDEALRAELRQRQAERIEILAQVAASAQRVADLDAVIDEYRQRIGAMMTGGDAFSVDSFDACRRYIEETELKKSEACNELDARRNALAANDEQTAQTRHSIAQNRGRIDTCKERVRKIENRLNDMAVDAEDEENEEMALARLSRK
jgi:chromosome segregation ATPase